MNTIDASANMEGRRQASKESLVKQKSSKPSHIPQLSGKLTLPRNNQTFLGIFKSPKDPNMNEGTESPNKAQQSTGFFDGRSDMEINEMLGTMENDDLDQRQK